MRVHAGTHVHRGMQVGAQCSSHACPSSSAHGARRKSWPAERIRGRSVGIDCGEIGLQFVPEPRHAIPCSAVHNNRLVDDASMLYKLRI
jgi:hypothetical protein